MKILSLNALCLVPLLYCNAALAGNGHVDKIPDVAIEAISNDGLKNIKVTNSILSTDEIKYLDIARKHLASKFGDQAKDWLIMVDLANQRVLISDLSQNPLAEILFKDL